jgi:predicted metal-dependent phosphoesterase TrpH
MVDLHLHTTASDGRLSPEELVARAHDAGIDVMAVTDHDTMAGVAAASRAAAARNMVLVPGIEITAVLDGRDVHVLAYYLKAEDPPLVALLASLRHERMERAREIGRRLASAGAPVDIEPLLESAAAAGASVARPQIAAALIAAGHARDVADAFDRWLSEGRVGYVPHCGPTPAQVVETVSASGGVPSLAHPGTTKRDDIVPALTDVGLAALEAYHSAHDPAEQARYVALARRHGLAVTGGSDFHGDGVRRAEFFGVTALPRDEYERFQARVPTQPA